MKRIGIAVALLLVAAACTPSRVFTESSESQLLAELAAISASSDGTLGVSAVHLESSRRVRFNASERFPMASTFKLPAAVKLLSLVDRGTIALSAPVMVTPADVSPGSGSLRNLKGAGEALSVGKLLELSMRESDNTAADLLLAIAGGPASVNAQAREMGIEGIELHRPAAELVADSRAALRFLSDPRDNATPDAMVSLLERIHRGEVLSAASKAVLIDHMLNCKTGVRRIKAGLPHGAVVAHKTGTLSRVTTNDVGIVTLPWNGGHLAIALFLKGSPKPLQEQEAVLAEATRRIYGYLVRSS